MLFELSNDALHHFFAFVDVSHLATTKQNRDLNFVFVVEKSNRLFDFELDIVLARFRPHANLFQLCLMRFVLVRTLILFILEFAIVHDATNRRIGVRSDFYKIQPCFLGLGQCIFGGDDSELVSILVDDA